MEMPSRLVWRTHPSLASSLSACQHYVLSDYTINSEAKSNLLTIVYCWASGFKMNIQSWYLTLMISCFCWLRDSPLERRFEVWGNSDRKRLRRKLEERVKNDITAQKVVTVFMFSFWLITIHHLHASVAVIPDIFHCLMPDRCFLVWYWMSVQNTHKAH